MSKIYSNSETIEIEFPEKKFQEYLSRLNLKSIDDIQYYELEQIFIFAYKDFKKGFISLDSFSEICGVLWQKAVKLKKQDTDLGKVLYSGSELNFYVRNVDNENDKQLLYFLVNISNYIKNLKL